MLTLLFAGAVALSALIPGDCPNGEVPFVVGVIYRGEVECQPEFHNEIICGEEAAVARVDEVEAKGFKLGDGHTRIPHGALLRIYYQPVRSVD